MLVSNTSTRRWKSKACVEYTKEYCRMRKTLYNNYKKYVNLENFASF